MSPHVAWPPAAVPVGTGGLLGGPRVQGQSTCQRPPRVGRKDPGVAGGPQALVGCTSRRTQRGLCRGGHTLLDPHPERALGVQGRLRAGLPSWTPMYSAPPKKILNSYKWRFLFAFLVHSISHYLPACGEGRGTSGPASPLQTRAGIVGMRRKVGVLEGNGVPLPGPHCCPGPKETEATARMQAGTGRQDG